jgi:hypothetical protein
MSGKSPKSLKIWAWLSEYGSHEIYSFEGVKEDFKKSTGQELPAFVVPTTIKETRVAMINRALGGVLYPKTTDNELVVWGYVMAQQLARNLASFESDKMGRGRIFYECVAALKEKGL